MAEKQKVPRFTTPKGIAAFVYLKQPDTKFKATGEYSLKLTLPGDDPATQTLIEKLEPLNEAAFQAEVESYNTKLNEAKGADKAKLKAKGAPTKGSFYEPEYDDEGNETGNIIIKPKMNAQWTKKNKDGSEEIVKMSPQIFDAKGQPIKTCPNIASGSVLKCNISPAPYYVPSSHVAGISIKLNAVQIIELVTFGGGGNAGSYGFGQEEGYESNPENEQGFKDECSEPAGPEDF